MKIIRLFYQLEYPPANIVPIETSMTKEECREIVEPIIRKLTRILKSEVMLSLTFAVRDEAQGDWQFIADYWREAEKKFL